MINRGAAHDAKQSPKPPCTMSKARKIPISNLNDLLTCKLCRGYYIDATTIIECLHSFCRSCIVKYLEKNKYCPICDVQVHKTKPLINIRQDKILQSCVYKLVPRLFQSEMLRRKGFYSSRPEAKKNLDLEELGEANYQHILASDENICVALNYKGSPSTPRYLQCSAAISIFHLQKLIRSKYDLSCNHHIDIFHDDDVLNAYLTLIDVAYNSLWRRKGPLELTYRIYESTLSPAKLRCPSSAADDKQINNNNNASNDWKEVQIQISENGEMSVTGIQDCLELLDKITDDRTKSTENPQKDTAPSSEAIKNKITKVELNQPPSDDTLMTNIDAPVLPTVTLTVAEIRELSKVEEAAKTQLSDAFPLPPPAKKAKKELPDLKLIANKSQTKNGAKITSPVLNSAKNGATETIAQPSSSSTTTQPVNVTSVTVIAPSTTATTLNAIVSTAAVVTSTVKAPSSSSVSEAKITTAVTQSKPITSSSSSSKRKHPSSLDSTATTSSSSSEHAPAQKFPKPTILNHTLGMQKSLNLSKNHPLTTKHQKDALAKATTTPNHQVAKWTAPGIKTYGTLINIPKVPAQTSKPQATATNLSNPSSYSSTMTLSLPATTSITTTTAANVLDHKQVVPASVDNSMLMIKSKASTPIGYKTLKDPPKTWNPTLQPIHLKVGGSTGVGPPGGLTAGKAGDLKNVRPAKFFKMRNNMPRYLGCPNSGVKPMFQVHVSPEKDKATTPTESSTPTTSQNNQTTLAATVATTSSSSSSSSGSMTTNVQSTSATPPSVPSQPIKPATVEPVQPSPQIRKHSIVKIDPKTLKPISEKAPECSNLSTKTISVSGVSKAVELQPKGSSGATSTSTTTSTSTSHGKTNRDAQGQQREQPHSSKSREQDKMLAHRRISSPHHHADPPPTTSVAQRSTPSTTSSSSSNLHLRINTTSVSITNPLKKGPHSPKKPTSPPNHNAPVLTKSQPSPASTASTTTAGTKLSSPQLNYTPSNPFIPNPLASPTLNPNQFNLLTAAAVAAAAQGFHHHGYDPRYHHHHHLPYHHGLYQPAPRLPPGFTPGQALGGWWAAPPPTLAQREVDKQAPLSSSANRNSSARGLIWNGPSAESQVCSPKEAKTATSATMEAKTSLDVSLPRSSSHRTVPDTISASTTNNKVLNKETNINAYAHERKEDNKARQTGGAPKSKALSESEEKNKAEAQNKVVEKKSASESQSTEKEKAVPKNTSADTPKENVVVAV